MNIQWKGPDFHGYWYTMLPNASLNVRKDRLRWKAYVNGEPLKGNFPDRRAAQLAAESAAEGIR